MDEASQSQGRMVVGVNPRLMPGEDDNDAWGAVMLVAMDWGLRWWQSWLGNGEGDGGVPGEGG